MAGLVKLAGFVVFFAGQVNIRCKSEAPDGNLVFHLTAVLMDIPPILRRLFACLPRMSLSGPIACLN